MTRPANPVPSLDRLSGEAWPVAGGRWPGKDDAAWPVTGGRWPGKDDAAWPVSGGRWPATAEASCVAAGTPASTIGDGRREGCTMGRVRMASPTETRLAGVTATPSRCLYRPPATGHRPRFWGLP